MLRRTSKHRTDELSGALSREFEASVIICYTDNVLLVQNLSDLDFEKGQRFSAQSADAVQCPNWNMDMFSRGHLKHRLIQLYLCESLHDSPTL